MSKEIGKVLGTNDAEPLGYWVAVPTTEVVQLDDVVSLQRPLPGQTVNMYGVVDSLITRHEGARLDTGVVLPRYSSAPPLHERTRDDHARGARDFRDAGMVVARRIIL